MVVGSRNAPSAAAVHWQGKPQLLSLAPSLEQEKGKGLSQTHIKVQYKVMD